MPNYITKKDSNILFVDSAKIFSSPSKFIRDFLCKFTLIMQQSNILLSVLLTQVQTKPTG